MVELKCCKQSKSETRIFSCPWWYSDWQAEASECKCISIYFFSHVGESFKIRTELRFFFFFLPNRLEKEVTVICEEL